MGRRARATVYSRALACCVVLCFLLAAPIAVFAVTVSWSDRLADLPGAADLAGDGRGVTVAVLDTWVDVSHPAFGGRVSRGVTCAAGACAAGADQPDRCDPHGTHVTGIIASTQYGVAPEANVLPIRVLTSHSGTCAAKATDVALGIRFAIAHQIKLINVSLGSTYPLADPQRVLPAAVAAAKKAGDLVVVAAGNGDAVASSTYGPDALTVAALGPNGQIASYSQRGKGVDIAAPGGDATGASCDPSLCVVSTWQDGGYASDAGTSMAAPFVSGTAALLLSQDPHRTTAQVRKIILSTAQPLRGASAGRLDVLAAVKLQAPKTSASTGSDSKGVSGTPLAAANPRAAAPAASKKSRIGPAQLLGILVVGGVGVAFVVVVGRRSYSK